MSRKKKRQPRTKPPEPPRYRLEKPRRHQSGCECLSPKVRCEPTGMGWDANAEDDEE
jgi:hypothetical protein